MKVGIYTLGCKVNSYESEYVANLFKDHGYEIVPFSEYADIYVINTCTVTNNSDSKSRKIIREAIRNNNHACIVAMGCFIESSKDSLIDGIRINFKDGWGLVRASNTGPNLTLRFEAKTKKRLEEIQKEIKKVLDKVK